MSKTNLNKMTAEELETYLRELKQKEADKAERERKKYEALRDKKIEHIMKKAQQLYDELSAFKALCHHEMDEQAQTLSDYGKIRSNSKGGFTITNSRGDLRITRRRDTEPSWDERSTKAIELIKSFLSECIKKRDEKMHEILMSFLQRNDKGDLEYSRVMSLLQHQDKFTDERWVEGLKLLKESYGNHLKGYGYEFKVKNESGNWNNLILNFSGL